MRSLEAIPSGFLLLHKPAGVTSFKCIARLKHLLPYRTKIGHAGTLDPFASGLLIVAIGRAATRQLTSLMNLDKTYTVRAKLGELTNTLDVTGATIAAHEPPLYSTTDLEQAIEQLGTSYEQVPPIFSALRHQGARLYELARAHYLSDDELATIALDKKRLVHLHHVTLESVAHPFFTFTARVSKGTYIRALANDIAQQLGTHATTYELVRTAIGHYSLSQAHVSCDITDLAHLIDLLKEAL